MKSKTNTRQASASPAVLLQIPSECRVGKPQNNDNNNKRRNVCDDKKKKLPPNGEIKCRRQ